MKRPKSPKAQNPIPLPYSTFCSSGSLREGSAVPLAFKTEACNTIHKFCLLSKPKLFPFQFFQTSDSPQRPHQGPSLCPKPPKICTFIPFKPLASGYLCEYNSQPARSPAVLMPFYVYCKWFVHFISPSYDLWSRRNVLGSVLVYGRISKDGIFFRYKFSLTSLLILRNSSASLPHTVG